MISANRRLIAHLRWTWLDPFSVRRMASNRMPGVWPARAQKMTRMLPAKK